MAAEIEGEVKTLLQNSPETSSAGITGVKVTALRNGSVIADMTIASSGATLPVSSVQSSINNGISNGDLASLGASGTISVQGMSLILLSSVSFR